MNNFSQCIEDMNRFTSGLYLRKYQMVLACGSPLKLFIPQAQDAVIINNGIYFNRHISWLGGYSFSCQVEIWLLAAGIIEGFPILKAVELKRDADTGTSLGRYIYEHNGSLYGRKFVTDSDLLLQQLIRTRDECCLCWTTSSKSLAIVGHPNFAHHAWNELSAIEELVSVQENVRSLCFAHTNSPLGRISDIFPEFDNSMVFDIQPDKPFFSPEYLPFRFGSSHLSAPVCNRIIDHAGNNLSSFGRLAECHFFSGEESHYFWCTVRNHNRVLLNQEDFYARLIISILKHHPSHKVVIDAFSLQADTATKELSPEGRLYFKVRSLDRIIERIFLLATQVEPSWCSRILSINGASILDAIYLAKYAHFYISYAGSVQHKIGWFHSKPGILIGPDNLERKSSWYEKCAQPAQRPLWIPTEQILVSPGQDDIPPKNRDFTIVDIDKSSDFILYHYSQALLQSHQAQAIEEASERQT